MSTVLIVEDEKSLRDAMLERIGTAGYTTLSASNGEEGITQIQEHAPDLVVLDVLMPIKSGIDVLKFLRHTDNKTPVIVLTNLDSVEDKQKGIEYGGYRYFVKSETSLEEIVKNIDDILNDKTKI
jgi:DNA-binding response OmpR family regulator